MLKFSKFELSTPKYKDATLKLIDFGNVRDKPLNKEKLYQFSVPKEYMLQKP